MNEMKLNKNTQTKLLSWYWTDKNKYLIHYRMLSFYVRPAMIIDKVHEIPSFRQSNWLEKYIRFNTQKRNAATNEFEKELRNNE